MTGELHEGDDPAGHAVAADAGLAKLRADRRRNLERLVAAGLDDRPVRFDPTHRLAEVRELWAELPDGHETGAQVTVAGRLVAKRGHGRLAFGVLRENGVDLQLMCPLDALGDEGMGVFDALDVGDWVGADGEVVVTRRGELSVRASKLTLLGKCLRPWPDKWHGLEDVEQRLRQRELDLVVNERTHRIFTVRSKVVSALRHELEQRGFLEVETPMLQPIPGGASARPFVTHHNALDVDLYLRVAPELYLKRLIVAGLPKVYELNRCFRNEGMSPRHNPEFTMLETYEAYADYNDMMALTEALVRAAALAALGTLELTYQGRPVPLSGSWPRRTMLSLVREATGRDDLGFDAGVEELRAICSAHGVEVPAGAGPGRLVMELYELLVERELWDPTFVIDYPEEVSPLARRHRTEAQLVERFELVVAGREIANAFSELTDPDLQRERFEAQAAARAAGDDEAMAVDEAYLAALELGMPPTGGLGVGVDRLVMLLADAATIRDVILFPTLRPDRP